MSVSPGALVLDVVLARWLLLIGLLGAESRGALCRQGVGVLRGAHRSVFVGRPGDTEMCGGPNRCDSMATFRRREGIFQAIRR